MSDFREDCRTIALPISEYVRYLAVLPVSSLPRWKILYRTAFLERFAAIDLTGIFSPKVQTNLFP
jgi:hypothetical protein